MTSLVLCDITRIFVSKPAGTLPNIARNCIINVGEIVVYDVTKEAFISSGLFNDGIKCHFSAAVVAGFCATIIASPVDVIKTRYS